MSLQKFIYKFKCKFFLIVQVRLLNKKNYILTQNAKILCKIFQRIKFKNDVTCHSSFIIIIYPLFIS